MTADEIRKALEIVAVHTAADSIYAPIFQRLERELAEAREREAALIRAREIAQMAMS